MKRFIPVFVLLMSAALLTSCYMMSVQPTGTIRINLGGPNGRSISSSAKVRVSLYTYNSTNDYTLFTFPSGKTYTEFSYGTGTQSVTGVPTGLWQVLVSIGSDGPTNTDAFYTTAYGASQVIDVTGGTDTSASVTTQSSSFVYSPYLAGQDLNSVAFDYGYGVEVDYPALLVSNGTSLDAIINNPGTSPPDLSVDPPGAVATLPAGLHINSLSEGIYQYSAYSAKNMRNFSAYLSTNEGIIPVKGTLTNTIDPSFSATLTGTSGKPLDILAAGAASDQSGSGDVIYYARASGLGGVFLNATNPAPSNGSTGANWVDIARSSPTGGNSIYQMAVDSPSSNYGFAYFATTTGAFRVNPTMVTAPGNPSSYVEFSAPSGKTIQAVAVDEYDHAIYIGTSEGAYYATLNESSLTSVISGSWTPIPATAGDNIVSIKTDASSGDVASGYNPSLNGTPEAVAFRSRYNLYLYNAPPSLGGTEKTYPFYAGMPETINSMTFAYGTLFVAGSEGLESVN